jgi:nicotinamidase/pyrazinamidase
MDKKSALLVVDVQNDFCPGGALAVPDGDKIVPVLNSYIALFTDRGLPVIATRDWHPPETTHFKERGGLWPPHCVQGTKGAEFHPSLRLPPEAHMVSKGMDPRSDDYSAFQALTGEGRGLSDLLRKLGVERLFIGGLATDYCVSESAMDALSKGFSVMILSDAVRGVDLKPGDSEKALSAMSKAGAKGVTLGELHKIGD